MEQLKFNPQDIIYYVEENNIMRLLKEITFKRAKKLNIFGDIEKKFKSMQKIKKFENMKISNFHFYIVIEAKNLFDKDKNFKSFFEKNFDNMQQFQEEYDKLLNSIKFKTKVKNLKKFKDLGKTNKVTGCYLLLTSKTDKSKIKTRNSSNIISSKFNLLKRLPIEIKEMCSEYKKFIINSIIQEKKEINMFNKLKKEDREEFIKKIIQSLRTPIVNDDNMSQHSLYENFDFQTKEKEINSLNKIKLEDAIGKNLNEISDIELLNSIMQSAINKEDYEQCGRIRDRIKKIKKKSK